MGCIALGASADLAQMFMKEFLAESEGSIFGTGMEDVLGLFMDEGQ